MKLRESSSIFFIAFRCHIVSGFVRSDGPPEGLDLSHKSGLVSSLFGIPLLQSGEKTLHDSSEGIGVKLWVVSEGVKDSSRRQGLVDLGLWKGVLGGVRGSGDDVDGGSGRSGRLVGGVDRAIGHFAVELLIALRVVKGATVVATEMRVFKGMGAFNPIEPKKQEVVQGFVWQKDERVFGK